MIWRNSGRERRNRRERDASTAPGVLEAKEDEHLECKEAKTNFHFETLVKYCVALANEGGGMDGAWRHRPRAAPVVGSRAFADLERTKAGLIARLRLRIEAEIGASPGWPCGALSGAVASHRHAHPV